MAERTAMTMQALDSQGDSGQQKEKEDEKEDTPLANIQSNEPSSPDNHNLTANITDSKETETTTKTESSLAAKTKKKADEETIPPKTKRGWKWPSFSLLSFLQGSFLVVAVYNQMKNFLPFGSGSAGAQHNNNDNSPFVATYANLYNDMYSHVRQVRALGSGGDDANNGLWNLLWGSSNKPPSDASPLSINSGLPALEYITLEHLNGRVASYRYSVNAATRSKAAAASEYRTGSLERALRKALAVFANQAEDCHRLVALEQQLLTQGKVLLQQIAHLRVESVESALAASLAPTKNVNNDNNDNNNNNTSPSFGASNEQCLDPTMVWNTSFFFDQRNQCDAHDNTNAVATNSSQEQRIDANQTNVSIIDYNAEMTKRMKQVDELILQFLNQTATGFGPMGHGLKEALLGHMAVRGGTGLLADLQQTSIRSLLVADPDKPKQRVLYVTQFDGDLLASKVASLRKEVTAIVQGAQAGVDEVLVIVQSAGGTVTGYGLVAAQLLRIKQAGLKLTIAVEQVAASGGYMATCVGDKIVCSPFAMVGSIGVRLDAPNFFDRLEREGVQFQHVTAGKFKQTLSPTKKITEEDLHKAQQEIDEIWSLFKDFVSEQRPQLDMDVVATGESWLGRKALELGLCDEMKTADEVLIDAMDAGFDVYHVKYEDPSANNMLGKILDFGKDVTHGIKIGRPSGLLHQMVTWLFRTLITELSAQAKGGGGSAKIYASDSNEDYPELDQSVI